VAYATEPVAPTGPSPPVPSIDRSISPWLDRAIASVDRNWRWALAALILLDAVLLLYMGRGLSFFYDDWNFVTEDYGGGIHSLLRAHVGNISVFPIAVYKVLFHLVGLNHYAVFRVVLLSLHLLCGGLVYVLAARRVARVPALLAAALVLFLGAAWEDLLWAFQIGYLLSVAGGLAAWVALERRGRWSEVAAMLCVVISAGSSSLGIAVMIGVAVELACGRRWRSIWIVIIPVCLYALWYLGYGQSQITENGLINAPGFTEDIAAAAFGGLVGRSLEWGRPLALLGVLLVLRRLIRPLPVSPRLAGLIATALGLWVITAVARATITPPEASRYVYLGAVVIVLAGVELLGEVTITARATALATLLVGFCALTGLTVLHAGAGFLRTTSETVTAELGALELGKAYAQPGYQPDPKRAPQILAGPYLHTVLAIGSTPADTPAKIAASDATARAGADTVLIELGVAKLSPLRATRPSPLAPAPATASLLGAHELQRQGCLRLTPLAGGSMTGVLTLPTGGVTVRDEGPGPASLALRRFGETFDPLPSAVGPRSASLLSIPADSAQVSWQLQVMSASPLSICGLLP
jgi:hypothetical protein